MQGSLACCGKLWKDSSRKHPAALLRLIHHGASDRPGKTTA